MSFDQAVRAQSLRFAVIVGSTRLNRRGGMVSEWFVAEAQRHTDATLDAIDLAEMEFPAVLPSSSAPEFERYRSRLEVADGFVVVTPEYNHGYPASLKQAIDMAHSEWAAKPVGFVSYGGRTGGVLAVEQLRGVFAELHAVTLRDVVAIQGVAARLDGDRLEMGEGVSMATKVMLMELVWWAEALKEARGKNPYTF